MEGSQNGHSEEGHMKSILKPRSKPSTHLLKGKGSNVAAAAGGGVMRDTTDGKKRRVEITTPPHSSTSLKRSGRAGYKHTPLPRVALLPPKSANLEKLRPKPKTFLSHRASSLKRSNSTTTSPRPPAVKASASMSKLKSNPVSSSLTGKKHGPNFSKRSKSTKKMKKKSKSTSDLRSTTVPPVGENGGKEYIKQLVTINELLKSVTDPTTQESQGAPLIGGFVRPFSADELHQLLTSVGKVATIHQDPASLTPQIEPQEDESKKSKTNEIIISENVQANENVTNNPTNPDDSPPAAIKVKKKKRISRRKSNKVQKTKSTSSTNSKNAKDQDLPPKSIPAQGSANKNLASKKTLKSNVKTLKSKSKKNLGDPRKRQSLEDLESELSELDLVKSAILNRKYYEESLALEHMNSKDDEQTANKKSSESQKVSANKKKLKDLRRLQAAHNSAHELISPVLSRSSSPNKGHKIDFIEADTTSKPGAVTAGTPDRSAGPLPLRPLKPTDTDDGYSKAIGNVLINYSHVIRPSTRRGILEHVSSKTKLENRGVAELERMLESDNDTPEFEKHIKSIKYGGPIARNMLDIGHVHVSDEPPSQGKYTKSNITKLSAEENLPTSILDKNGQRSSETGLDEQRVTRSRRSHRRNRKSRSPSSQEPHKSPMTAPVIGYHGPLGTLEKKMHTVTRGGLLTHSAPQPVKLAADSTIFNLVKPHPSRWNEQSIAPSLFVGLPDTGASRWTILNERILEKNKELTGVKNESRRKGTRQPYTKGGNINARFNMDVGEERRNFLQNLDKAKKAFDTFGVHNSVMDRKPYWKPGKAQYANIANAFGFDTVRNGRTK